jgi:hypothetical protein
MQLVQMLRNSLLPEQVRVEINLTPLEGAECVPRVGPNQCTVIRIRIWWEIVIYGYGNTAYLDTPYFRMYGSGQPYVCHIVTMHGPTCLQSILFSLVFVAVSLLLQ